MIAMSAGGCAGAGPSSGFSGWKRTSGAVTSATPLTRNRCGGAPGRGVSVTVSPSCACSVAASCWSSTISPGRSDPRRKRKVWRCAQVAGRDGEDRARPELDRPERGPRCDTPANGAVATAEACATPGWRRPLAGDADACTVATRPGPASRAARCAIARRRHRPQRVADEEDHRRRAARPRPRARARAPACGAAHGRGRQLPSASEAVTVRLLATTRPSCSSSVAREARGDVGVVGRDDEREPELAPAAHRSGRARARRCRSRGAGRLVAEQELRLLRERAGDRDPLGLAAGELGRQVVGLPAQADQLEQRRRGEGRVGLAAGRPALRRRRSRTR